MLKEVELVNICQFKHLKFELPYGLTVFVGPQGSGKTNALTMGLSAVVGTNPLEGDKSMNILHDSQGPAYIKNVWVRDNNVMELVRGYRKCNSAIMINGELDKRLNKEGEITEAACGFLGVSPADVFGLSYVRQSETAEVLKQRPTTRVEFFSRLLGCEALTGWSSAINTTIAEFKGALSFSYKDKLNELIVRRDHNATKLAKSQSDLKAVKSQMAAVVAGLEAYAGIEAIQNKFAVISKQISEVEQTLERNARSSTQKQSELAEANQQLQAKTKLKERLERDSAAISNNALRQQKLQLKSSVESQIASIQQLLIEPKVVPISTNIEEDVAATRNRLSELMTESKQAKLGSGTCPTCGGPLPKVRDVATINRELEECKKKSRDLDTEIATHNQQQKTWDSWNEKKQTRELSLKELQGQLKDISDWAAANPEVAVDADLSQYTLENVGSEQVAIVAKVGRLGGEISQLLETATAETAKLRDLQLQRNAIPAVDANQWSMMQSLVAQKQELQEALTEKETVHNSLLQEQASVQSLGEELISSYRRERQYADALSIAESVMPLVRPTGVPQAVLRGMLKHTADRMTALCQELGQPFIVDVDDNLEFAVRKPNGRVEIARRLSGGQQACLAVVLWLTRLMQGLGPGLPILVLDEPSANMGPDVIPQFAQLLMTLNKILIEKKKQVVITTHHSQLQYCGAGQIRFEL